MNFNIKDRKMLYGVLSIVLVCVFTLTIAYSALSAVLTITGNARVTAADWDIYLSNARVTNGSATTVEPTIKTSSTLEFSTTLNMPGDFYEFTVDVVNGGSIDAMIENVVKNPELTAEQAKYLKYEITYQNGESITTKQTLPSNSSMPIKVRVEYRRDISASDLPTSQTKLDLAITLEYVQSDGTGSDTPGSSTLNDLTGKTLMVFGTSISMDENNFVTTSYNEFLASKYNMTLMNYAVGGDKSIGILNQITANTSSLSQLSEDDFVIVEGFLNGIVIMEVGTITPVGTTSFDTNTFTGGLEAIIYYIQNSGSKAKLGIILTHVVPTLSNYPGQNFLSKYNEAWDAMISVCEKYNVPYLDLRNKGYELLSDGVHLTQESQLLMANDVEAWLKTLS